jgi:Spy/CpxP family protein refolding chaperone
LLVFASLASGAALAADNPKDVFKGKLFPPNVILENRDQLNLSKEQFTAIRAAVVEVQAGVAEHEWDMQEAYQALMLELDQSPVDEDKVLEYAGNALLAENQVKKKQMAMLVRLKNLLTAEQIEYLESVHGR